MKKSFLILLTVSLSLLAAAQQNPYMAYEGATVIAGTDDAQRDDTIAGYQRLDEVFEMIFKNYVDNPDMDRMSTVAINAMLKELDPHSMYIAAKDVKRTNEQIQGNFEGIGVTFQIVDDTICVGDVIADGPAEKVGMQRGDKIVRIDGENATGDSIDNNYVMKHIRGDKGTTVVLDVLREGETLNFHIVRDKIPIYSVDSYFMVNDSIGYIRLARFARTSVNEFRKACQELQQQGMKAMIFDLRGNSGGYLDIACGIANEFLNATNLLVYTQGRNVKRQNYVANSNGSFRKGRLVVLIDENSASASEIVSGAVQDWDRGTLIGRRSFGKGLVQRVFNLKDGGQVRLTTARYYTPSGRCIQKPYEEGTDAYNKDIAQRFMNGELSNADSVHMPDSLKFYTSKGRTVYGGGGIMPDIFVPLDTTKLTPYFVSLRSKGLLNKYPVHWAEQHRHDPKVKDFDTFMANYDSFGIDKAFAKYAEAQGVERDRDAEKEMPKERIRHTEEYLHNVLKAMMARTLFGSNSYYLVMRETDEGYLRAVKELQ